MTNAQRLSIVIAVIFGGAELSGCAAQVAAFKKADAAARGATEACFGVARRRPERLPDPRERLRGLVAPRPGSGRVRVRSGRELPKNRRWSE